jgi:hypothetical protein
MNVADSTTASIAGVLITLTLGNTNSLVSVNEVTLVKLATLYTESLNV